MTSSFARTSTAISIAIAGCLLVAAACGDAGSSVTGSGGATTSSSVGAGGLGQGGEGTLGGGGTQGAGGDVGVGGAGGEGWTGVPLDRPLRLLFVGNSFTHQGPVPHLVRDIASSVGWPTPDVDYSAPGGETLGGHRQSNITLGLVDAGSWDFVVLQDHSLRATDNAGDLAAFKADATWFYDRIKDTSAEAQVLLYETWARHPDHPIYPGTFATPMEMQTQIRFHYGDAASVVIPTTATFQPSTDVDVAPVGDAWENHLAEPDPLRLHATDDYHGGPLGQYLNALVLYSTIYGVVATGVSPLGVDPADAARLQATADATTGITQAPPAFPTPPFAVGQSLQIDFGTAATSEVGWNVVGACGVGTFADLLDATGAQTGVDLSIPDAFTGSNESGLPNNGLGYPGTVSSDVCWVGSFDSHQAALLESATVRIDDLAPGTYEVTLFASRSGDDGGLGRLTRFSLGGQTMDLEASDNQSSVATFAAAEPDSAGSLTLGVAVSPAGAARFGYLGALVLTKTAE
ncbi:MAG: hypothetical protein R3B72_50190 [Polyangiaceae bacterium]